MTENEQPIQSILNQIYQFKTIDEIMHFQGGLQIIALIIRHKDCQPVMQTVVKLLAKDYRKNDPVLYKAVFDVLEELECINERVNKCQEIWTRIEENKHERSDDHSPQN